MRRITDLDPAYVAALNAGAIPSATLTEGLAIDFAALLQAAVPALPSAAYAQMHAAAGEGITRRMAKAAQLIADHQGLAALPALMDHTSDTVRGWACYLIGGADGLALPARLEMIRPLADDPHFGVREWAWMAVRPHIAADPAGAISHLTGWTDDPSARIRRFASEATRPRGVWCAHITSLRQDPGSALSLLQPLRADPAAYVQDSVANWLNDASKDRPDWVRALCADWLAESPAPETARICKRALRTVNKR
ncbi:HEAT repeat domain-containing protein [Ketogulonicigenium vulgare]|uniref:HEAT repeat domain-containing protein n=1 Tax=Ketogulonicigenium vulgare TaxID=92945 RepID=UPI0023598189|nr:HEAT repeat domain-containing protein [Ketogulonicigenium vulgare]